MGLRYPEALIAQLLEGVREMEESVTYQAIIKRGHEAGRVEEARAILLRQGARRFGPPSSDVQSALEAITAIERLEQLSERLLDVESWEELLAG
jgi:hypothetical protein